MMTDIKMPKPQQRFGHLCWLSKIYIAGFYLKNAPAAPGNTTGLTLPLAATLATPYK